MKNSLFRGAWMNVVFIHYEVEPARLQAEVSFPLDRRDGKAYVSVVAFSQERLRFALREHDQLGGALVCEPRVSERAHIRAARR